jgi:hypothetical protein
MARRREDAVWYRDHMRGMSYGNTERRHLGPYDNGPSHVSFKEVSFKVRQVDGQAAYSTPPAGDRAAVAMLMDKADTTAARKHDPFDADVDIGRSTDCSSHTISAGSGGADEEACQIPHG